MTSHTAVMSAPVIRRITTSEARAMLGLVARDQERTINSDLWRVSPEEVDAHAASPRRCEDEIHRQTRRCNSVDVQGRTERVHKTGGTEHDGDNAEAPSLCP